MKRPGQDVIQAAAMVAVHQREFSDFIAEWYNQELDRLPDVQPEGVARAQGRCQVLRELNDLFSKAPEMAAQARKGKL